MRRLIVRSSFGNDEYRLDVKVRLSFKTISYDLIFRRIKTDFTSVEVVFREIILFICLTTRCLVGSWLCTFIYKFFTGELV